MYDSKLRKYISEDLEYPDSTMLSNPTFDDSVIGVSTDGHVIYDFNRMILEMAEDEDIPLEEAAEFIECDTLRAIPYMPDPKPIVMLEIERFE